MHVWKQQIGRGVIRSAAAGCLALTVSALLWGAEPDLTTALGKLDSYVNSTLKKTGVPGASVAVVYKDQIVFLKGYGVREVGTKQAVNADTVFQIASFSKPIATTVVAELVGQGKVDWDDRIKDLDPKFALSDDVISQQVTLRDLLSHRSTLPGDAGDTLEALGYTRPEILHRLRLVPLNGVFRKTYQYSNFGITEGALAATRRQGATWETLAEQLLYDKLGMTRTSSRFSDYINRQNRAALHYLDADGVFRPRFVREADAEAPAGGVSSSARDLAQWLRLQLAGGSYAGEQIVNPAALEETHTQQVCRNTLTQTPSGVVCPNNQYYGLGWDVDFRASGEKLLSHSGAFLLGAATTVYMIPSRQIGILVLSNGSPVGLPEAIALDFLDTFQYGKPENDYLAILREYLADKRQGVLASSINYSTAQPPAQPSSAAPLSSYVGTYSNRYYGRVEVELQNEHLILRLPPLGAYYELTHWDGNTFTYYIANESSGAARRGVEFFADGKELHIQNLDFEIKGTFVRDDAENGQ